MAIRLVNPNIQYLDGNGDPYSGGKLYFYESGTSTPLDTYSDSALSVANANPVVLDSAGRASAIFLKGQDYKVVLKTSADVTVWTEDPVAGNTITGPDASVDGSVPAWDGTGGGTLKAGYAFKDEDAMTSDSATAVASQQSIKAYSDTKLKQGTHTIFIPAAAMRPTSSNGCASIATVETTAGRPDLQVLDFDASADEHAQFQIAMPKSWDEGTITFRVFWTSTATDTDGVAWALQGVACADDDTIDVAYGTAVVVTDDNISAAEDMLITDVSAALTIAGSPAAAEMCFFRVFRDVSDANDDMTEDARLIGVQILFTIDAGDDT